MQVSWFAAQAYCEAQGARLPTWLEWEYAAAADETRRDARKRSGLARTHPRLVLAAVERPHCRAPALQAPNAYGVQDLHGLVWEWTEDFSALLCRADNRDQGDPDNAKFCGAGALSMDDRDNYAVLMRVAMLSSLEAERHHRQPRLPLREGVPMKIAIAAVAVHRRVRSRCRSAACRRARRRRCRATRSISCRCSSPTSTAHRFALEQQRGQAAARGDVLHVVPVHLPADRRQRQGRRAER